MMTGCTLSYTKVDEHHMVHIAVLQNHITGQYQSCLSYGSIYLLFSVREFYCPLSAVQNAFWLLLT